MTENLILTGFIPALFNPQTGMLDAACIAQELHLPLEAIASSLGCTAAEIREHPDAPELQPHLYPICRIWSTAMELYAGEKASAHIFLNASNEHLEKKALIDFIKSGDLAPLEAMMAAMSARQPT